MAHFVLKTPESSACVMQAPWVDEPWISKRMLAENSHGSTTQPYYVRLDAPHDKQEPVLSVAASVKVTTPELLPRAAELEPNDEYFFQ